MPTEHCKMCGERMTEQPAAYETVGLAGVPEHSDRFYEQWFIARMAIGRDTFPGTAVLPDWLRW